jgi:hypothetical protein
LEHFELVPLDFQPYYEDKSGCVSIIVPDPKEPHQRRRALGYIKYDKQVVSPRRTLVLKFSLRLCSFGTRPNKAKLTLQDVMGKALSWQPWG